MGGAFHLKLNTTLLHHCGAEIHLYHDCFIFTSGYIVICAKKIYSLISPQVDL